jgi:hypothetical protein
MAIDSPVDMELGSGRQVAVDHDLGTDEREARRPRLARLRRRTRYGSILGKHL